jgi:hypothetical protein
MEAIDSQKGVDGKKRDPLIPIYKRTVHKQRLEERGRHTGLRNIPCEVETRRSPKVPDLERLVAYQTPAKAWCEFQEPPQA